MGDHRGDYRQDRGAEQPSIYVKTLNTLEVSIGEHLAHWKGGGSGARQLRRAFGYLVARRDRPVRREALIEIAGSRTSNGAKHVIYGLRDMLHRWGMEAALKLHDFHMTLHKNELWLTDTDQLEAMIARAQELNAAGEHEQAIVSLEQVEDLCGGDYLPILDLPPVYGLDGERAHWRHMQKKALHMLVQTYLLTPHQAFHSKALCMAINVIDFDRDDPVSCDLAAEAAWRCNLVTMALQFEQQARELRQRGYGRS